MSLAVVGTIAGYGDRTLAQIAPDNTLGTENSVVTPVTPDSQIERIDGGATRGTNLLHSFEQFNIREGQAVFFSTPAGIERIFSRVTGGSPSEIFGTLGVLGADLFFLNPNGIIFCPNAQLNVSGSFLASTASGIKFDDGTLFSAKNPQSPPILQLNIPIGLQFEGNAGSIVNRSVSDLLEFRLKQGKNSSTVN
jgi:filamentous hemagglutinin family protein